MPAVSVDHSPRRISALASREVIAVLGVWAAIIFAVSFSGRWLVRSPVVDVDIVRSCQHPVLWLQTFGKMPECLPRQPTVGRDVVPRLEILESERQVGAPGPFLQRLPARRGGRLPTG